MNMIKYILLAVAILSFSACQSDASKRLDDDTTKRARLHYQLGLDALHKGLVPKAFEELYIADEIKPNQPDTLDAIAYAWRLRGDNKKAEKFYKKAIKANAGSSTYNNYGSLLNDLGRYDEAIKYLTKALEDPRYRNQSLVFVNLGDAYVGKGNLEEAVKAYRKAKMLSPTWTYPEIKEAEAYTTFHRPNYAQALYETILRREPANQQALAGLIALLKGQGQDDVLRTYIQAFIKANSDKLQQAWAKDELAMLKAAK